MDEEGIASPLSKKPLWPANEVSTPKSPLKSLKRELWQPEGEDDVGNMLKAVQQKHAQRLKDKIKERDEAIADLKESETRCAALEQDVAFAAGLNKVGEERYSALYTEHQALEEKTKLVQNQVETLVKEMGAVVADKESLQNQMETLVKEKEAVVAEKGSLQDQVESLIKEKEAMAALQRSFQDRVDAIVKEKEALEDEKEKLQDRFGVLTREKEALEEGLLKKKEECQGLAADKDKLLSKWGAIEQYLKKRQEEFEALTEEKDGFATQIEHLRQVNEELHTEIHFLKQDREEARSGRETLEQEIQRLQKVLDQQKEAPLPLLPVPPRILEDFGGEGGGGGGGVDYDFGEGGGGVDYNFGAGLDGGDDGGEKDPLPPLQEEEKEAQPDEHRNPKKESENQCEWWKRYGGRKGARPCAGQFTKHYHRSTGDMVLCQRHTCTEQRPGCRILTRQPSGAKCDSCKISNHGKERIKERDKKRKHEESLDEEED